MSHNFIWRCNKIKANRIVFKLDAFRQATDYGFSFIFVIFVALGLWKLITEFDLLTFNQKTKYNKSAGDIYRISVLLFESEVWQKFI